MAHANPPRPPASAILRAWLGGFLAIAAIGLLAQTQLPGELAGLMLLGSFGASAVLLFAIHDSPYAQPRNLIGGHLLAALVGVACQQWLPLPVWLNAALAVSLAIAAMQLLRVLHPPGGATALLAVIGGPKVHALGFGYVLSPVLVSALIMLGIALLSHRLLGRQRWPNYWV